MSSKNWKLLDGVPLAPVFPRMYPSVYATRVL
jgi:hypothetical protein